MSQEIQPLVYHSLSRHVHSIPTEAEHLQLFNIYSSNQQPPMPSILQRSRTKKSHEKSLKKGLSRVSKSKQNIHIGQGFSKEDDQKSLSKGTLLNFNIQEVIDNKLHITKPRDQVMQISPRKGQIQSTRQIQTSQPGSNQKSFISEYRIVTYVPSGRVHDQKRQYILRQEKESMRNESGMEENWDKENNSNNSNVFRNTNLKNESEPIQVINPTDEHILEQDTWRTSDNFDPYYSNNFGSDINQANEQVRQTQRQQLYSSLKPKYSVPVNSGVNEIRNSIIENGKLKDKIKHLEHEIVQIQREKNNITKNNHENHHSSENVIFRGQNQKLRQQYVTLKEENTSLNEENTYLREQNESNINKAKRLDQHILNLEQKIAQISQQTTSQKQRAFSQSYLFQDKHKQFQQTQSKIEQIMRKQIETLESVHKTLELANTKLSKDLSEKSLIVTEFTRKNKDLTERMIEIEKQLRRERQKMENQEQKLYRRDQKINSLSLQVDRLNLLIKETKEKQARTQLNQKGQPIQPHQFQSLSMNRSREQRTQALLREELETLRQRHQQLSRDYTHLEKKNMFMKDQLEHLKYLQVNASSAALSHRSSTQNNYNSLNVNTNNQTTLFTTREKQLQQTIYQLQTRLQINERNFVQVQEEYSNLKQNFRALEELYIKQQDSNYQFQQDVNKLTKQNNILKIQLSNLEQISKAKNIAIGESQSLKLMDKQQELLRLKKQFSSLQRNFVQTQRKYNQTQRRCIQTQRRYEQVQRKCIQAQTQLDHLQDELKTLLKQRDDSHKKYMNELQKNTQLTKRHKEDLDIYISKMQKQQKQKISIVANKYETLITKLNEQILSKKNQLITLKESHYKQLRNQQQNFLKQLKLNQQAHLNELTLNQEEHKKQIETLLTQIDRQQLRYKTQLQNMKAQNRQQLKSKDNQLQVHKENNELLQSRNQFINNPKYLNTQQNRLQTASKMNKFLNYQTMSRKQLQSFTTQLQQDLTIIENKYKTILIQNQRLQDHLESTTRQLTHLEQQLRLYKQQKQNSLKQKYELRQQVDRTNLMMLDMKKTTSLFDQQKHSFNSRINQLNQKYLSTVQDYERLIKELKDVKNILYDKEIALENYHHDIRELRINLLEEKEITEKKVREICILKQQKQAIKSKEEYYKMLFEKTQRQLQHQLQQKALLLTTHAPKVPNPSPIKHQSPQKKPSVTKSLQVSPKTRQTQLYRMQIFKDLNRLLNLTNQHFTLEEILQKNEQQYLRKLYNAIKQDHQKIIELKQLIMDMENGFSQQKVFIKSDYDVLYEKYLKYKTMCQEMNRDIERYKLKLKGTKDHDFININV